MKRLNRFRIHSHREGGPLMGLAPTLSIAFHKAERLFENHDFPRYGTLIVIDTAARECAPEAWKVRAKGTPEAIRNKEAS